MFLTISIEAGNITAKTCIGLTDEVIKTSESKKKDDVVNNLTALCYEGCGKACVESKIIQAGVSHITDLKDEDLKAGCNARLPYGKACYLRRWTDSKNTKKYLEKGCEYSYAQSCRILAVDYRENNDYSNFSKYASLACDLGDIEECFNLALVYYSGKGIKKDKMKAYKYWMIAAKRGDSEAQNNLDVLCKESPWACK